MNKVAKGRIVLYRQHADQEPHAAIIVKVWNPSCVNLKVFDENGEDYRATSATLGDGVGQFSFPVIEREAQPSPSPTGDGGAPRIGDGTNTLKPTGNTE